VSCLYPDHPIARVTGPSPPDWWHTEAEAALRVAGDQMVLVRTIDAVMPPPHYLGSAPTPPHRKHPTDHTPGVLSADAALARGGRSCRSHTSLAPVG